MLFFDAFHKVIFFQIVGRKYLQRHSSAKIFLMAKKTFPVIDSILEERKAGHLKCRVIERPAKSGSETQILDDFVAKFGFVGLGDEWKPIHRDNAQLIAQIVLQRDLAYGFALMSEERARELATQFLELFAAEARYFTNGEFDKTGLRMWSGLTKATFDSGIIGLDSRHLGILWVQDED